MYAGWARASAGSSGALDAGALMGPGAVKGRRVLVRELADITTYAAAAPASMAPPASAAWWPPRP